ncbi:hypothetical protein DFR68_104580 [Nocardia mexicana]|uniref:Uncharacterized protein n=1 Tax=Nocardia mexicana TaxID=279262 RepID=A0A370H6R0_9NOCA|nr:hypothetical protein DFR68_104580 [Nocardia mexicana]
MILGFGPLAILLPHGSLARTVVLFCAAVLFAIGVMIFVSVVEGGDPSARTSEVSTKTVAPGPFGGRPCEPFCGPELSVR